MSDASTPVPNGTCTALWILSGFLGSGKTSSLNALLRGFSPRPVGVLVNDFGSVGVDARLVESPVREAAEAGQVVELNGGQIFCSCISGSFVRRVCEIAAHNPEAILVESSGMAKPLAMGDIIGEIERRTQKPSGGCEPGAVRYCGMLTIVDARRFDRLRTVVNAVDEQVVYADVVVVNKIDTVDEGTRLRVVDTIRTLNPACGIVETTFGAIDPGVLPRDPVAGISRTGPLGETYLGWGDRKPQVDVWRPAPQISRDDLARQVAALAPRVLRIKGFVQTAQGRVVVSAVADDVRIDPAPQGAATQGAEKGAADDSAMTVFASVDTDLAAAYAAAGIESVMPSAEACAR